MIHTAQRSAVLTMLGLVSAGCTATPQAVHVLTNHNDAGRTGANLQETRLSPSSVSASSRFGKLFEREVDGHIYGQPLYVTNLSPGRNVVVVATMHNSVYAFDADDPNNSKPVWFRHLADAVPAEEFGPGYRDIRVEVGVVSTPVIDLDRRTVFVVNTSRTTPGDPSSFAHDLHALDLESGVERPGSPVRITGSYPGSKEAFQSFLQLQRAGLLLSRGVVYFAFASYRDRNPFHGWVFGYDAATLKQVAVFNTTPASLGGGIWQSGQGISADEEGQLYLSTGNGFGTDPTVRSERGESVIRLSPGGPLGLTLADFFTPFFWKKLDEHDTDLGSTGVLLVPGINLAITGSKGGVLFVSKRQSLGGLLHEDTGLHASIWPPEGTRSGDAQLYGSPVYWQGGLGRAIYVWPGLRPLRAFVFGDGNLPGSVPAAEGTITAPRLGGILSISANHSSSGIVWAALPRDPAADDGHQVVPGVLRAYDASNLKEIWNSEMAADGRDQVGAYAKFVPPTIANGKVYLATFSRKLVVYGLPSN